MVINKCLKDFVNLFYFKQSENQSCLCNRIREKRLFFVFLKSKSVPIDLSYLKKLKKIQSYYSVIVLKINIMPQEKIEFLID